MFKIGVFSLLHSQFEDPGSGSLRQTAVSWSQVSSKCFIAFTEWPLGQKVL